MVAGVIKFNLKQDKIDEAIKYWNKEISAAKNRDVFVRDKLNGHLLMVNHKTGHGYAMGIWSNFEDSAEFQRTHFYTKIVAELEKFCVKPIIREQFEIDGGSFESVHLSNLAA